MTLLRKSKAYAVGSWFRIDLGQKQWVADWFGTWALVVVTHGNGRGVLVAYFFGPFDRPPALEDAAGCSAEDGIALLVGDASLDNGTWHVLGRGSGWNPAAWPSPAYSAVTSRGRFVRHTLELDGTERSTFVDGPVGRALPPLTVLGADLVPHALRDALDRRSARATQAE
jgi:hypothetical protein